MKTKTLIPFFGITFGLTWGIAALLILFTDQISAIFGEIGTTNPLIILAVYSPGIVGVFLVWRNYGLKGLGSFFRRLTLWRMPLVWWLFLILGIPVFFFIGAAIKGTINDPFPFSPYVPGAACACAGSIPRPHRRIRLAWGRTATNAAQALPVLGRLNPWDHLGALARPFIFPQWDAANCLGCRTLLPGNHRPFCHPDADVQFCSGQPADCRTCITSI